MSGKIIGTQDLTDFEAHLKREERAPGTIEKYLRDVRSFALWMKGRAVDKEIAAAWKESLLEEHYAPVTINSMLAAVNAFFRFARWNECRVKFLKLQRRMFRESGRELTRAEYARLLEAAHAQGRERLALLMETICATGIRVSEVRYITVKAAKSGRAEIGPADKKLDSRRRQRNVQKRAGRNGVKRIRAAGIGSCCNSKVRISERVNVVPLV